MRSSSARGENALISTISNASFALGPTRKRSRERSRYEIAARSPTAIVGIMQPPWMTVRTTGRRPCQTNRMTNDARKTSWTGPFFQRETRPNAWEFPGRVSTTGLPSRTRARLSCAVGSSCLSLHRSVCCAPSVSTVCPYGIGHPSPFNGYSG